MYYKIIYHEKRMGDKLEIKDILNIETPPEL